MPDKAIHGFGDLGFLGDDLVRTGRPDHKLIPEESGSGDNFQPELD